MQFWKLVTILNKGYLSYWEPKEIYVYQHYYVNLYVEKPKYIKIYLIKGLLTKNWNRKMSNANVIK